MGVFHEGVGEPGRAAMATKFRLLGEVDARVDGRMVEVGYARQRCVLAALLVDANRAMSADQLGEIRPTRYGP